MHINVYLYCIIIIYINLLIHVVNNIIIYSSNYESKPFERFHKITVYRCLTETETEITQKNVIFCVIDLED